MAGTPPPHRRGPPLDEHERSDDPVGRVLLLGKGGVLAGGVDATAVRPSGHLIGLALGERDHTDGAAGRRQRSGISDAESDRLERLAAEASTRERQASPSGERLAVAIRNRPSVEVGVNVGLVTVGEPQRRQPFT